MPLYRPFPAAAWALCLLGAMTVGISGFNSESNHPTYLPPGLHHLDPRFLANDWWLTSARHYHYAFFALTAVLGKLHILEPGLAFLNIVAISASLYICFRMIRLLEAEAPRLCLAILISIFVATLTFFSAGDSYLFTPSLQPSSIATVATLAALLALLENRLVRCGIWLSLAGLAHVNFLAVNIPFFGLAYLLKSAQAERWWNIVSKRSVISLLQMLGPSLLLSAVFVPLILSVERDVLSPAAGARADWIFFRFAVPFHYYPLQHITKLANFLSWELLGFMWTVRAVPDPAQRRTVWAIQVSFALIIWSATALTTFIFLAPVSRLYLWRLAPFATLFSVLLTIVGAMRLLAADRTVNPPMRADSIALLASFAVLPTIAQPFVGLQGQVLPTAGLSPGALILGLIFFAVGLRLWLGNIPPWSRLAAGSMSVGFVALGAASQPNNPDHSRYSLLVASNTMRDEAELFTFARTSTPASAQFLIPPDLDFFRLCGQRAIVVDFKAMPMNRSGLIEWYRRLEDISGRRQPRTMYEVAEGYASIDAARLEELRQKYGLGYAVLKSNQSVPSGEWDEVFRNSSFRVLAFRGG